MKQQPTDSCSTDFGNDPIIIYHSRKGAVIFGMMLLGLGVVTIAMFWYLKNQTSDFDSFPIPLIVGFACMFFIMLHILKHLLSDAGKAAITIGRDGVKFDRYYFIRWCDINDVYVVDDSDGPSCLWLSVKEGVTFLPDGPLLLIWLAKKTNLQSCIDISGYGSLSMSDKDIRMLLEKGLHYFGE